MTGFTLFIDIQTVITALPCYDEWCRTFRGRENATLVKVYRESAFESINCSPTGVVC